MAKIKKEQTKIQEPELKVEPKKVIKTDDKGLVEIVGNKNGKHLKEGESFFVNKEMAELLVGKGVADYK
jgi:hypothetical protein